MFDGMFDVRIATSSNVIDKIISAMGNSNWSDNSA